MIGLTSGTWVRRGSTILVDLGLDEALKSSPERELASSQPTLRQGSRGSAVSTLQSRLTALRFAPGPVDGVFGSLTGAAVRAFQSARGLVADGIVGPLTWSALNAQGAPTPSPPRTPAPSPWGAGRAVQLNVPFIGYESNDPKGCFNRCTEMAAAVGVTVGGPDMRIQVATGEDTRGRVTIDPAKAREGIAYIDAELSAGRPVVVGVSYMDASYNVDVITDHFVIITGRGTDPNQRTYYGYHDPASSKAAIGSDQNIGNRFYRTAEGGLFRSATANVPIEGFMYDVSMVRRNI